MIDSINNYLASGMSIGQIHVKLCGKYSMRSLADIAKQDVNWHIHRELKRWYPSEVYEKIVGQFPSITLAEIQAIDDEKEAAWQLSVKASENRIRDLRDATPEYLGWLGVGPDSKHLLTDEQRKSMVANYGPMLRNVRASHNHENKIP